MFKYFVSFSHAIDGNIVFGNTVFSTNKKISCFGDIERVRDNIQISLSVKDVVVINFVLLDD